MGAKDVPTPGALNEQVSAEVRAQRAWTARVVGATWAQAAEATGYYDAATCYRAVKRYFGEVPKQDKTEARDLWRARLEHLWRLSVEDVTKRRPWAVRLRSRWRNARRRWTAWTPRSGTR